MQMEMLEMELIKNLQNTQNVQRDAYKDLEKVLMAQTLQEGGPLANIEFSDPKRLKVSQKIMVVKKKKRKAESVGISQEKL